MAALMDRIARTTVQHQSSAQRMTTFENPICDDDVPPVRPAKYAVVQTPRQQLASRATPGTGRSTAGSTTMNSSSGRAIVIVGMICVYDLICFVQFSYSNGRRSRFGER
jgi:hypothetical protein